MYLRAKSIDETEIDSQIIGRYNRVDNYANITTIQSAIAAFKMFFEDPEEIIQSYGADAVRLFIMSDTPPEKDVQWSDEGMESSRNVSRYKCFKAPFRCDAWTKQGFS